MVVEVVVEMVVEVVVEMVVGAASTAHLLWRRARAQPVDERLRDVGGRAALGVGVARLVPVELADGLGRQQRREGLGQVWRHPGG
eukprot:2742785-Prymnesium_polylepis.1